MAANKIAVSFGIWEFEDFAPQAITDETGLTPSYIRTKNEPIKPGGKRLAKENGWIIKAPEVDYQDAFPSIEYQLDALIELLKPKMNILKKFCDKYYSEFSIALYVYTDANESTPIVHFTKEQLKFIADLRSACDIDIILLAETDDGTDW
ncbi:MAG: DUF4279 domain-containing protein [Chitinophagales bacterium]|nr:DUF4279 domain-containing protein [Chitinophagales bacterium]